MIVKFEDLADIRSQHQAETIVLTSGTFDLLHPGHEKYLKAVKQFGDVVVLLLSSDARVKARKGHDRPHDSENKRAQKLNTLPEVDYVLIDPATAAPDQIDPAHAEIVARLQPDVYATDGADPRFWNIIDTSKLVIVPRSDVPISTTEIIERMHNQ